MDPSGKQTCYKIATTKRINRAAARDYCRSYIRGANLVSIESAEERDFLALSLGGKFQDIMYNLRLFAFSDM